MSQNSDTPSTTPAPLNATPMETAKGQGQGSK